MHTPPRPSRRTLLTGLALASLALLALSAHAFIGFVLH